ncbi:MAG TPA: hypothetical protein VGH54_11135 [Mycobacterium sp.]|jgi:hypothetical protein
MPSGEMLTWCQQATTEVHAELDVCLDKLSREPGILQLLVSHAFTSAILTEVRQLDDIFRWASWLCSVVCCSGAARSMIRRALEGRTWPLGPASDYALEQLGIAKARLNIRICVNDDLSHPSTSLRVA